MDLNGTPRATVVKSRCHWTSKWRFRWRQFVQSDRFMKPGRNGKWHDILNREWPRTIWPGNSVVRGLFRVAWPIRWPTRSLSRCQRKASRSSMLRAMMMRYTGLINFPGDSPYITQVGGTTLTTSGPKWFVGFGDGVELGDGTRQGWDWAAAAASAPSIRFRAGRQISA